MAHMNDNRYGSVRNSIRFLMLFLVLILVIFVLSVSEPTKVALLGAGSIGIAMWARRTFKEERKS
jgi:small-conductance mechanosensitive channel